MSVCIFSLLQGLYPQIWGKFAALQPQLSNALENFHEFEVSLACFFLLTVGMVFLPAYRLLDWKLSPVLADEFFYLPKPRLLSPSDLS